MRKTPTILLAGVLALCGLMAMDRLGAQDAAPVVAPPVVKAAPSRVGVCDVVTVFHKCARSADLTRRFAKRSNEFKAEHETRNKVIKDAQFALLDSREPGTPDFQKEYDRIQEMRIGLRIWTEMTNAGMKRDDRVLTLELHGQIIKAIEAETKLRGIDIVANKQPSPRSLVVEDMKGFIASQAILYSRAELDLTSDVLKRVNEAYANRAGQ